MNPRERELGRALALAQSERDELVRFLGLLRQLGGLASQSSDLESGALAMTRILVSYLDLEYCGCYALVQGRDFLRAASGRAPTSAVMALLEEKVREGATFAAGPEGYPGSGHLMCLPLANGRQCLGGLAMVLRQPLDGLGRRHLPMIAEAATPLLEAFLLRGRLAEIERRQLLETRGSRRGLAESGRARLEAEACLAGLLEHDSQPVMILDQAGRLARVNPALEHLLGWTAEQLQGRRLDEFLARPQDWEELDARLQNDTHALERQVSLLVQAGVHLPARLSLRRFFSLGRKAGTLARLLPLEQTHGQVDAFWSLEQARALVALGGEAVNQVNNLLGALAAHMQLMLLKDLAPGTRGRLELLEGMTRDGKGLTSRVQAQLDRLGRRCQAAQERKRLWGGQT